jgi:hypothetical protein
MRAHSYKYTALLNPPKMPHARHGVKPQDTIDLAKTYHPTKLPQLMLRTYMQQHTPMGSLADHTPHQSSAPLEQ